MAPPLNVPSDRPSVLLFSIRQTTPVAYAFLSLQKIKRWRDAMVDALQINFALWGMIGCAACKSVQLIQFFN